MQTFETWWNKDDLGGICGKKDSKQAWYDALREAYKTLDEKGAAKGKIVIKQELDSKNAAE